MGAVVLATWLPSVRANFTMASGFAGLGCMLLSSPWTVGLGAWLVQLFFPAWQMYALLLAIQAFPSHVRGCAFTWALSLSRFGGVVAEAVLGEFGGEVYL